MLIVFGVGLFGVVLLREGQIRGNPWNVSAQGHIQRVSRRPQDRFAGMATGAISTTPFIFSSAFRFALSLPRKYIDLNSKTECLLSHDTEVVNILFDFILYGRKNRVPSSFRSCIVHAGAHGGLLLRQHQEGDEADGNQ